MQDFTHIKHIALAAMFSAKPADIRHFQRDLSTETSLVLINENPHVPAPACFYGRQESFFWRQVMIAMYPEHQLRFETWDDDELMVSAKEELSILVGHNPHNMYAHYGFVPEGDPLKRREMIAHAIGNTAIEFNRLLALMPDETPVMQTASAFVQAGENVVSFVTERVVRRTSFNPQPAT